MTLPWEKPPQVTLARYIAFMDSYTRVSVTVNGVPHGFFSVLDDGTKLAGETILPDGTPVAFRNEGHPRTTDLMMTAEELVKYVLTKFGG